ncbi:MAG: phosphoglycolate phosphatase [Gammaproteobacteria bacterium]
MTDPGSIDCVLLDLDGTLADTAPDMATALNELRVQRGLNPLAFEKIRPHVSGGSPALLRLGLSLEPDDPEYENIRQSFLELYAEMICDDTQLFPGMPETLDALERHSISFGIVTNKPGWLTRPLLDKLELTQRCACIVSGDCTVNRKPHPDPLLEASRQAKFDPVNCLFVGDDKRDIQAGRNAGMKTLAASWGYIAPQDDLNEWQADGIISQPEDLVSWLDL